MPQSNAGRYPNSKIRRNGTAAANPSNVEMPRYEPRQISSMGRNLCVPSALGTIREKNKEASSSARSSGGLDDGPDEEYWPKKITNPSNLRQNETSDRQDLATTMKNLTVNPRSECRWKGPRPVSVNSYRTDRTERIQRTKVTPRMDLADNREYAFPKHEFKRGMIFRAPLHEEDYTGGTAVVNPALSRLSVANSHLSTTSGVAKNHQHITDFGPVYSENRFMVVVVLGADTYIALPFYTHAGNGTAYKEAKDEYVSVQDHREPDKCVQQGSIDVVRTLILKDHVKILHEFTTAYLGKPISRKYNLPIVHQGRLTDDDTERLVSLFKKWVREH